MKELEIKICELNIILSEINDCKYELDKYKKYIEYIDKNGINHIGFDCSNTYHSLKNDDLLNKKLLKNDDLLNKKLLKNDDLLNKKLSDLLKKHYQLEVSELEDKINSLINDFHK